MGTDGAADVADDVADAAATVTTTATTIKSYKGVRAHCVGTKQGQ